MKKIIIPIIIFIIIILVVIIYLLYIFNYIPHKKYTNIDFNIETYRSNIDFDNDGIDDQTDVLAGVKNLKIYFERNAISLTTDVSKIEEWQGGDIIIFENHIGVISDSRNKNGVPFVIHHANPFQKYYEEDILETRNDIVGHYRIS